MLIQAPAKLNLFLHLLGRRPDGYHELQTLFQLIDWCDRIHLTPRTDGVLATLYKHADIPTASDLCLRAAHLLKTRYLPNMDPGLGVTIHVDKQIPIGAGLGGGSSDAAAVLVGLNEWWRLHRPRHELAELGLQLGADVPVFVMGQNAYAEGVGERLSPVVLPPRFFVVIFPNVMVRTADIFGDPALVRDAPAVDLTTLMAAPFNVGRNDLEAVACLCYPELVRVKDWLNQFKDANQFNPARMSGSGAAFFSVCETRERAQKIESQCRIDHPEWRCQLAQSYGGSE